MTRVGTFSATLAVSGLLTLGAVACGTNHDTVNPNKDLAPKWIRVDTPPGFDTAMMGCIGPDLVILDPDGNVTENGNDPLCRTPGVYAIVSVPGGGSNPKNVITRTSSPSLWQGYAR